MLYRPRAWKTIVRKLEEKRHVGQLLVITVYSTINPIIERDQIEEGTREFN